MFGHLQGSCDYWSAHTSCEVCLLELIEYNSQCPECRGLIDVFGNAPLFQSNRVVKNVIESLNRKCDFFDEETGTGCQSQFLPSQWWTHLAVCEYYICRFCNRRMGLNHVCAVVEPDPQPEQSVPETNGM